VDVRPRRRSDIEACLELARLVKRLDGYPPRGPVDVEHFMAPPQQLAAWVAGADSRVVGHVALHDTGAEETMALATRHTGRSPESVVLVARLLVGPAARRGGVGRALLDAAVDGAHARGRQPVLDVATSFVGAVHLYEACGWQRAGEVTLEIGDEPSLRCCVYVGPAVPGQSRAVTTR